jgi:hypothetical protein
VGQDEKSSYAIRLQGGHKQGPGRPREVAPVAQRLAEPPVKRWSGPGWTVIASDTEMVVMQPAGDVTIGSREAVRFQVRRRWFRWGCTGTNSGSSVFGVSGGAADGRQRVDPLGVVDRGR